MVQNSGTDCWRIQAKLAKIIEGEDRKIASSFSS